MLGQADARNWDHVLNETEATVGTLRSIPIALGAWTLAAGTPFVASSTAIVGVAASMTSANALVFGATADTGDIASLDYCTPDNFRDISAANLVPGTAHWSELQLQVLARKLDTTGSAAENATLNLTGDAYWLYIDPNLVASTNNDTALQHLTTPASAILDAKAGATSEEAFSWYTLDIGARMQAEAKPLKANSYIRFNLSVSAAVGTALNVEVIATRLRWREHPAFVIRNDRIRTNLRGSLATGLVGTASTFVSNV